VLEAEQSEVWLGSGDKLVADIYADDGGWAGIGIFNPPNGKAQGIGEKDDQINGMSLDKNKARVLIKSTRPESLQVVVEELQEAMAKMGYTHPASDNRPGLGQRKAAQVGQIIGVLAQNQDGEVAAVTDLGRCTWLSQDVTGANLPGGKKFWSEVDEFVTDYIEGYEFRGDDGDYMPSETEKFWITDCVSGLLQEMDQKGWVSAPVNANEPVAPVDAEYIRVLEDACDIIQADANTEENYGSLCRRGSVLVKLKADGREQDNG
jgi:hypothetical protein